MAILSSAAFKKIFKGTSAVSTLKQPNYLNTLPTKSMVDLIQFAESRLVNNTLYQVNKKRALILTHRHNYFLAADILAKSPQIVFQLEMESFSERNPQEGLRVRGDLKHWPFLFGCFDTIYLPLANIEVESLEGLLSEASRLLPNGTRIIVSLLHPQLEFMIKNQNPYSKLKATVGFENLFAQMRENGFFIEDIKEKTIDSEMRPYFVEDENEEVFEELKGTSLVLLVQAIRYQKC